MPRFAANLSMMFNEVPFLDRFARARAALPSADSREVHLRTATPPPPPPHSPAMSTSSSNTVE
ncbi:MAG: hypothetical protein ACOYOH_04010, partial [Paracraurococcus sp.]